MILIDNSKCTALLGTWPSMWAPNHEEAQSSPMMDLRALLYVVDKVFKRAERARQSKDPDPLADEAGWTNTGWWKWVTNILGKMTTNQYQSCFFDPFFWRKPYMSLYVKIKLLADPITLEPHCNILQSHLDSSFQIRIPLCWYIKGMGPDEIPQRMNVYSKKSVMQFLLKTCGLVLWDLSRCQMTLRHRGCTMLHAMQCKTFNCKMGVHRSHLTAKQ